MLFGIISQCGFPSCTLHASSKKNCSFTSVWSRREYIWTLNWKENLLLCFEHFQGVPCSYRQSRNRMMNTFIIVNITPSVRDSLEGKSMLLHFKKAFPVTSLGHLFERRGYWFVLSYHGIRFSHTGRVEREWWTLC